MSTKVKRKITLEHSKDAGDQVRRQSVFDRLGPGTVNLASQSQDRHSRIDHNEKCKNWLRFGTCTYGHTCRYQHDPFPAASSSSFKRAAKSKKEGDKKDLRHKGKKQKNDSKEPRTGSLSPKRKGSKRTSSRSRKGEHESKIKSTVVVTRPRSPPSSSMEPPDKDKKKAEPSWDDDSDDWPLDEAQLDYKEEMILEKKRQQLQRQIELEEKMMKENASLSDSSSSSSSSGSGSVSSSSDSSSSSSGDDSDDSSSSSSSSSSSASQVPLKKKYKKSAPKKEISKVSQNISAHKKLDDYDKIKSSRLPKSNKARSQSPSFDTPKKKGRDKMTSSSKAPNVPKKHSTHDSGNKAGTHHVRKGPRTPSPPPPSQKHRKRGQSSSVDSWAADTKRGHNKKHKKKKDTIKNDRHKADYMSPPPRLSSPNRTVIHTRGTPGKKNWHKDESKSYHKNKDHSPLMLPRISSNLPQDRQGGNYYVDNNDKPQEKYNKAKNRGRKSDDNFNKQDNIRDKGSKYSKSSPLLDSNSPYRYENDNRKSYPSQYMPPIEKGEKNRNRSSSAQHKAKENKSQKKSMEDSSKRRESPPRGHDGRKDGHFRGNEGYNKKDDGRGKRAVTPEGKKMRDDKGKDRPPKERLMEPETWDNDHKKPFRLSDRTSRTEPLSQPSSSKSDRSRDRERKKPKERDIPVFKDEVDRDRVRLSSPIRGGVDLRPHHGLRDELPVPGSRSHLYEPDLPPDSRDYPYSFSSHHDQPYSIDDRVLPSHYDSDILHVPSLYPPDSSDYPSIYSDSRYRRDGPLKEPLERIVGYVADDVLPPLGSRDSVILPVREDDFLDSPLDDRRPFDERWGRNRSLRDEWDSYSSALPPHVGANLDEDRYGMPRRRRAASPDWHLRRDDDRDIALREPRSRSPPHRRSDVPMSNRLSNPWREQTDRHNNRNDNQQKNQDDRKSRNVRKDRRDLDRSGKRSDLSPADGSAKSQLTMKEKTGTKRSRSSTPTKKDAKKRKEDTSSKEETISTAKTSLSHLKKSRDDTKTDSKTSSKSSSKTRRTKSPSPKPEDKQQTDKVPSSKSSDKSETKSSVKVKIENDEKKRRVDDNKSQAGDDFSDWSDGDDDLLNRDLNDFDSNSGEKTRGKSDDHRKDKASVDSGDATRDSKSRSSKHKRDGSRDSRSRVNELKSESRSRTESKERENSDTSRRNEGSVQSAKESDSSEAFVIRDEAEDLDDFMMTESVDYDPISDEELEAMIDEPDDSLGKSETNDDMKIVDALDVDWSILVNDPKPKFIPGNARKHFKAAHVLSRIGFSKALAGSQLTEKITKFCQQQLDEEHEDEMKKIEDGSESCSVEKKTFELEHDVAAFHVALREQKKQRQNAFSNVGPARRALCARQDLNIRKLLCRPVHKLVLATSGSCVQQYGSTDADASRLDSQPPIINATC